MVAPDQDFNRKVLSFFRICKLEFGVVLRNVSVSWHCWLGQEFIGTLEGGNGSVEVGPNPS